MDCKLVCSDIDGTLLNKERVLSEKTVAVIKQIKNNFPVVLISSRMPKAMRHLQLDLDIARDPLIAYNGGLILTYEEGQPEILLSIEIAQQIAGLILTFVEQSSIHVSLYHADEWFVPEMDYWAKRECHNTKVEPEVADLAKVCEGWTARGIGPHKIMCMGEAGEIQLLENWLKMYFSESLNLYRSKPTYLEIASKQISKLSALSYLLDKKYSFGLSQVMAFGDNYNDIELIEGVGRGVAVSNAKTEVKAVADEITQSNLEDGVARTLASYFIPS